MFSLGIYFSEVYDVSFDGFLFVYLFWGFIQPFYSVGCHIWNDLFFKYFFRLLYFPLFIWDLDDIHVRSFVNVSQSIASLFIFFPVNFLYSRLNNYIVLSLGLLIPSLSLPFYYQANQQIVLLFILFISSRMYIQSFVITFIFMILFNFSFVLENL